MLSYFFAALQSALNGQGIAWLIGTAVLLAVLAAVFAYLLRGRTLRLEARLREMLATRAPRIWLFLKRRFSREAWHGLTLTLSLLLLLAACYAFAQITEGWVDQEALYQLDRAANKALSQDGVLRPSVVSLLRAVTHLGSLPLALVLTAGLALALYARGPRWHLHALLLTMGGGEALLWALKFIFSRARPGAQLASSVGYAFPSGHSFTAMAFYGFLIFLIWRRVRRPAARMLATLALGALILLVGLSRVLLSVHWISDVLGGFALGLAWLVGSLLAARAFQAQRRRRTAT